jgi:hypothetical protein
VPARLTGREPPAAPSLYAELSVFLLKRRRMLPWRDERAGESGMCSSVGDLDAVRTCCLGSEAVAAAEEDAPLVAVAASSVLGPSSDGVRGGVGTLSTGDGCGGGMFVPSVRENLKSSTGSSKRRALDFGFIVVVVVRCARERAWGRTRATRCEDQRRRQHQLVMLRSMRVSSSSSSACSSTVV